VNRRSFLALAGGVIAWSIARSLLPRALATPTVINRAAKWAPQPTLLVDWRYAAGRIVDGGSDYGFVVSLNDIKAPSSSQQLLVERQSFTGARTFFSATYAGTLAYDGPSLTYTFRDTHNQLLATWQLDQATPVYHLTVTTTELALANVVLRPQGTLIPEGGDGAISVGHASGIALDSDYYADWTVIEIGGIAKGTARVDMQGLRPAAFAASTRNRGSVAQATDDYDHYWFAVAGQCNGEPVWISAWRIDDHGDILWDVTIAQGSGVTWGVTSYTEQSTVAEPLAISILAWQPLPPGGSQYGTSMGATFRLTAGLSQPGDLLSLELTVPPGEFTSDARLSAGNQGSVEEAVGTTATGTVLGEPLSNVSLVVAESTTEFYLQFLPLMLH
jgi:hypothetical protein